METFAEYILKEKDYYKKLEIVYYLQKKYNIFFDNSVILKTELARLFIQKMNIEVDSNFVITACLLYACKKSIVSHDIEKIKRYAVEGAIYLETLGFSSRFCKVCTEVNRYVISENREKESDILEIVDNFGGLVLDRPERKGFPIDEAINLIENRNLKGKNNRFLNQFKEFIYLKEGCNDIKIYDTKEKEVHQSKSEFNEMVVNVIDLARISEDAKTFITYLSNTKSSEDVREEKDRQRIEERMDRKVG